MPTGITYQLPNINNAATVLGSASLYSDTQNIPQLYAVKGICPLCESTMSASMLAMIQTYWDSMKAQIEDEIGGKSSASITLEEISPLIPTFLKRFRTVYDQVESKHVAVESDADNLSASLSKALPKGKPALNPNSVEAMDIVMQTKTTLPAVLEFVLECYCLQWQSILKNGNDSMLTVMFKASNKKKFSQKTNDMKSKAIIEFLSSASASEVPELLLFNHLIGLLPKPTSKISPGE
ncbi:hypothetical protein EON65_22290 [archaeon]|nr:MAG: hypothetical protein EON65_22290 [archaeon]